MFLYRRNVLVCWWVGRPGTRCPDSCFGSADWLILWESCPFQPRKHNSGVRKDADVHTHTHTHTRVGCKLTPTLKHVCLTQLAWDVQINHRPAHLHRHTELCVHYKQTAATFTHIILPVSWWFLGHCRSLKSLPYIAVLLVFTRALHTHARRHTHRHTHAHTREHTHRHKQREDLLSVYNTVGEKHFAHAKSSINRK